MSLGFFSQNWSYTFTINGTTYIIGPPNARGRSTFLNSQVAIAAPAFGSGYAQPLQVPVLRHLGTLFDAYIPYTFTDETAVNGVDYVGVDGLLFFDGTDGPDRTADWVKHIPVSLIAFTPTPKTFKITIFPSNSAGFPGRVIPTPIDEITVTMLPRAGAAGLIGFTQASQRQNPNTTVVLQVRRSNGNLGAVDVDFHTEDGTGIAGVDYTATTGQLSWANGDSANKTITVTLAGPATDKTFKVILTNPTNGAVLSSQLFETTVTIIGTGTAGDPGVIGFEYDQYQTPVSTVLAVKVKRVNGKSGAVSVTYQTANGIATAGVNYTAAGPTVLNWADQDDADKTINLTILAASIPANFFVNLTLPTGGATIDSAYDQANVLITGGLVGPTNPLYDVFVGDFCSYLKNPGDQFSETILGYMRGDILVRVMEGEVSDDGVIGFGGGSSNNGDSLDYSNNYQSLLPSPPNRFRLNRATIMVE